LIFNILICLRERVDKKSYLGLSRYDFLSTLSLEQIKILNINYEKFFLLRGNNPNIRLRIWKIEWFLLFLFKNVPIFLINMKTPFIRFQKFLCESLHQKSICYRHEKMSWLVFSKKVLYKMIRRYNFNQNLALHHHFKSNEFINLISYFFQVMSNILSIDSIKDIIFSFLSLKEQEVLCQVFNIKVYPMNARRRRIRFLKKLKCLHIYYQKIQYNDSFKLFPLYNL
jgi:hypothetical protein